MHNRIWKAEEGRRPIYNTTLFAVLYLKFFPLLTPEHLAIALGPNKSKSKEEDSQRHFTKTMFRALSAIQLTNLTNETVPLAKTWEQNGAVIQVIRRMG